MNMPATLWWWRWTGSWPPGLIMSLLWILMLSSSCKPEHHNIHPSPLDCSAPHNAQAVACKYSNELGRGQYEIRDNVAECTDAKGQIVSADGQQNAPSDHSQKTIFLRCLFQGGALSVCVQHNDCQVIMSYDDCQQELKKLQTMFSSDETASKEAALWECQPKPRQSIPALRATSDA